MKNNRKNRKLTFIRNKNSVRLGFNKVCYYQKVSNIIEIDECYKNGIIKDSKEYLYKMFKLKLPCVDIQIGHDQDDFIHNLKTVRVILSLR